MIKNFFRFGLLALIFILTQSFLRNSFISYYKKIARKSIEHYIVKNHYKATIRETDSTLEVTYATLLKPTEIYYFDSKQKCYKQAGFYNCDSCIKKMVKNLFDSKRLHWVKISDKKFIANKKFILELDYNNELNSKETTYSYILKKEKMNKKDYNNLIGSK